MGGRKGSLVNERHARIRHITLPGCSACDGLVAVDEFSGESQR